MTVHRHDSSLTRWASRGMGDYDDWDSPPPPENDWWWDWNFGAEGGGLGPGVDIYGGGGGLPTGGGVNWWDLWAATPTPLPGGGYAGEGEPPLTSIFSPDFLPSDGGSNWWSDWFSNWFPPDEPGTLEPIPIDWANIGTSISPFDWANTCGPGQVEEYGTYGTRCVDNRFATKVATCGQGTYNDPADPSRCIPFPPGATDAQKRALQQQGQQAAQQAQARANQQQALQQAAQQCAARGGRLIQTATGYACQLPNGQTQPVNLGGFDWTTILLLLLGVAIISR